jgi:hypothetical protein
MPRFVAIPVAQGDAFYLERADFSVLVDVGRSRYGFPGMFRAVTHTDRVNVAVCTHNDADHANGVIGFLETGLKCDEMWLPGSWLAALPHVLKPFVDVFVELTDNVAQSEASSNKKDRLSDLFSLDADAEGLRVRLNESPVNDDGPSVGEDGWPESYVQMLEQAEPWEVTPRVGLAEPRVGVEQPGTQCPCEFLDIFRREPVQRDFS